MRSSPGAMHTTPRSPSPRRPAARKSNRVSSRVRCAALCPPPPRHPAQAHSSFTESLLEAEGEGPRATELEAQTRDEEGEDGTVPESLLLLVGGCDDPCLPLFISGLSCHPSGSPPPIFTPSPLTRGPRLTSLHPCALQAYLASSPHCL